ncbi:RelA/SpoT domain-containing protein [Halobacillus kuroshimensis]|uniref:RelA/SpoT domain-containing protein n=1 Tax=Halobacillus kuroshimensis TaxID=302481 RepID=A0ABS3E143_9BACI|nr:RelA/SpoT domain-containing protein [Halobacillus kuroshimensis]MBN8237289.1 RelA/SpoT domain-containing protein [Halobacillus kuroshimensis]
MDNEIKLEKFAEQYMKSKEAYEKFTNEVSAILKSVLKSHSIKHQVVSKRVKEYPSLQDKVLNGKIPKQIETIFDVDDISGCRVIFYLESDIQKFTNLIFDEFTIEKDNLIYTDDGYNARHLVVRNKTDSQDCIEDESIRKMKCEIQLTTVLFHAWSEMSHKILYKLPEEVSEFDEQSISAIKEQFKGVMKNHIKPASYTFDYLNERYQKLLQGKRIFGFDFLQTILLSSSRNEVYEKVNLLSKFVVEFGDKTPDEYNLVEFIPKVINHSKTLSSEGVDRPLGRLFSIEHYHIAVVCLDIINHIRYINIDETIDILKEQISADEKRINKKAIEVLNNLTQFNLKLMDKAGYLPQLKILSKIEEHPFTIEKNEWDFYETTISNLLKLEFDDTTLIDYKKLSITTGSLGVNAHLKQLRNRVITLLEELYKNNSERNVRINLMKKFTEVSNLPRRTEYDGTLEELVKENTVRVLRWLLENFEGLDLQEIKVVDENLYKYRNMMTDAEETKKLDDLIKDNNEYEIYKTLVGNDLNNRDIGWREAEKIRKEKTNALLEDISLESYDAWEQRIVSISAGYDKENDWEFRNFKRFLFEIGKQKTEVAQRIITKNENSIEHFLSDLVAGLWTAGRRQIVIDILCKWIEEKTYLSECAEFFLLVDTPDISLLDKLLQSIKEEDDFNSLFVLLQAILRHEEFYQDLNTLFMQIVLKFAENQHFYWTNLIWFDENSILNHLTEDEFEEILSLLTLANNIDIHEEEVLKPVCSNNPKKVISFFSDRVERAIERSKDGLFGTYSAIPHSFYSIGDFLKENSQEVLTEITKWFYREEYLFKAEAAQLIKNIFPNFESDLEDFLIAKIGHGNRGDAKNILSIIKEYEGDIRTHEVLKNIVREYYGDTELIRELTVVLTQTGVVWGEYGFIESYRQTKKEVRKWQRNEQSEEIKDFVKDFIDMVNKRITQEQRRADRNIEMMQREFDR